MRKARRHRTPGIYGGKSGRFLDEAVSRATGVGLPGVGLPASGYRRRATGVGLRATGFGLPASGYRLLGSGWLTSADVRRIVTVVRLG